MLIEYPLNIPAEIAYAQRWAFSRNPAYYDFTEIGGDCTNFISQCLYAGGAVMNYTQDTGWFYISLNKRAPAWTGVAYFHNFLIRNRGAGPFGMIVPIREAQIGDVLQLGRGGHFYHSLLIVAIQNGEPYVTTHSRDAFYAPLSSYEYDEARCIHILGARKYT